MIIRSGVAGRNQSDRGGRPRRVPDLESKCIHGFYTPVVRVPIVSTDPDTGATKIQWITKKGSGECPH